jgi:hypothetical protein
MSNVGIAAEFDANLPNFGKSVRIRSFHDAQVFVRRWAIRDTDRAIRALLRVMEKANSSEAANCAIGELKRELAARGLLPDGDSPVQRTVQTLPGAPQNSDNMCGPPFGAPSAGEHR